MCISELQCSNETIQTNRTSFFFVFGLICVCVFFSMISFFRNSLKQKQYHSFPKLITHISNTESLTASKHWPMAVFIAVRFYLFHGMESHYVFGRLFANDFPLHFFVSFKLFLLTANILLNVWFIFKIWFPKPIQVFTHVSCLKHTQQWVFSNSPHITHQPVVQCIQIRNYGSICN